MKKIIFSAFVSGLTLLSLQSCVKDTCTMERTYTDYEAVYAPLESVRSGIAVQSPRSLSHPGKIYLWGDYIFVNELNEGIHIIDNQDPSNPQAISFIAIPGNVDMAVKGHILYADSYIDLLTIDLSNPAAPIISNRLENVFPQYDKFGNKIAFDPAKGVIVSWTAHQKQELVEMDCNDPSIWGMPSVLTMEGDDAVFTTSSDAGGRNIGDAAGVGGSMARFSVFDEQLYTVDFQDLHVFQLSDPANPGEQSNISIGANIETIWPYGNHLYIGSQDGMHIYNIDNPAVPVYVSTYQHITSCDPVVVQGNYAYVTLRSGSACRNDFSNQLDVVDISNKTSPVLIASYPLSNPRGLGIDGSNLFVCDEGLKMYNASDVYNISNNILMSRNDLSAYDVIPYDGHLLLIGEDGLFQYTYTSSSLSLLSSIPVVN